MTGMKLLNGKKWFINNKLKINIDILISDVIASNMDFVLIIDGEEGSGKSFAARALGCYIQTLLKKKKIIIDFDTDNIHFNIEDYITSSALGGEFQINILDESREALGRNKAKSKIVERFVDYMSEARIKRQFHIIVIPSYHDLHSYIAQWRARAVLHFKKSYAEQKNTLSGFKIKYGEYKFYTDRDGLSFNHRMRNYKYPNNYAAWAVFSNKETFTPDELERYNAKKLNNLLGKFLKNEKKDSAGGDSD